MFDALIDRYWRQAQPVVAAGAEELRRFGCDVLSELRAIHGAVADDDNTYYTRHYASPVVTWSGSASFTGIPTGELAIVPPNEEWKLEFASARGTSAGTLLIYRNGVSIASVGVGLGNQNPITLNFTFQGGDQILYELAAAGAMTGQATLVFRVKRTRARHAGMSGIQDPVVTPGDGDMFGAAADSARHVRTGVYPGTNIVGNGRSLINP